MPRKFSIELADDLATKIADTSARREIPIVDVFRDGMEEYFQCGRLHRLLELLLLETVKTRAFLRRCSGITDQSALNQVLDEATKDAEAELTARRKPA